MSPDWTPTYWFSAFWQTRASASGSRDGGRSPASAQAVTSSSAADDERPAPVGRSDASAPRNPVSGTPAAVSAQAVPAT